MRTKNRKLLLLFALPLIMAALSSCVSARPVLRPEVTLAPTPSPTPEPTPEPTPSPTPEPTPSPAGPVFDANGELVSGADHYEKYISFRNIQVYEQEEDTFIDCIAVNAYPETLFCALGAVFYDAEGASVAHAQLQTREGDYALTLPPGETTLFAQVDTDMTLTALDMELLFDETLGVKPGE